MGRVPIGAKSLLDINFIWFGYIARLSHWGGGGCFTRSIYFYLPYLRLEEGGGGQHPVVTGREEPIRTTGEKARNSVYLVGESPHLLKEHSHFSSVS
jgi:hypothetical protein